MTFAMGGAPAPGSDRIPVELFQILKDDAVKVLDSKKKKNFKGSSADKESVRNAGDLGSIPGLGRSPGEGIGYPLQ